MTAFYVAMSVSFCLPHPVVVSAIIICSGLSAACTEMLLMCVLYVSFLSKVRPITIRCIAMNNTMFILRHRLLLYSAGSGVNRVQVVLSGFSVRSFSFVQANNFM